MTVWAGPDLHRVDATELVHTFPGMLFCFLLEGAEPPIPYTLGQLLQFWSWSPVSSMPESSSDHAHCLVYRSRGYLSQEDSRTPWRYREHIAGVTGACLASMRLFAGQPRPLDIAIRGIPCYTAIAVGDRVAPSQPPFLAFRPLGL